MPRKPSIDKKINTVVKQMTATPKPRKAEGDVNERRTVRRIQKLVTRHSKRQTRH